MGPLSLGDMGQAFLLRRQTVDLKSALQTGLTEVTTGRAADLARKVGGDYSALAGIDASLARLDAYRRAGAEAGLMAGAAQTALGTLDDLASDLAPTLLKAASTANPALTNTVAADGHERFRTALSLLNARVGDRSVFAGQATDRLAVADAETILMALEAAIAPATLAQDIETAVSSWFDDPLGFEATAYLGGPALSPAVVAEGENARLDVTATNPAVRDTLKGLAMAALLDRGTLAGAPAARADLARRAGEALINAQTGRTALSARIGIAEAKIADAAIRNEAEASSLDIARAGIVSVDPYEAASRLQDTQTQLETIYALTARLSRLSLTDFLR